MSGQVRSDRNRRGRFTAVGAATAVGLLLSGATVAHAEESVVDEAAALVAQLAPYAGEVAGSERTGGVLLSGGGAVEATFPANLDGRLVLSNENPAYVGTVGALSMSLPHQLSTGGAEIASDGSVVYLDEGAGADLVAQALSDGSVRLQTILEGAYSPTQFTYGFDVGLELLQNIDGSIEVLKPLGDGVSASVAVIDAPWAVDAEGNAVATSYVVDGSSLTQTVETNSQTAYPVVADPSVSLGTKIYVHFNRAETRTIADSGSTAAGAAAACALVGSAIGGVVGAAVGGAACIAVGGTIVYQAGVAQNSSPKQCLLLTSSYPLPPVFVPSIGITRYLDSRCS